MRLSKTARPSWVSFGA